MIDLSKLDPEIVDAARQNLGLEAGDTRRDAELARYTPAQLFSRYCSWHGLVGWGGTLWATVEALQAAGKE